MDLFNNPVGYFTSLMNEMTGQEAEYLDDYYTKNTVLPFQSA
jgi:hypothetical protein